MAQATLQCRRSYVNGHRIERVLEQKRSGWRNPGLAHVSIAESLDAVSDLCLPSPLCQHGWDNCYRGYC